MNCYLPWKLNDMTSISAEKLQRNINQQVSYLELYKGELVKEAFRFNVASILKYTCIHRDSFGNDPLSRKATDCLIVFLHAMAVQRNAFFTPSDSETSIQAKGCRNLHRLMLENLKATMRYIDYSVLLDRANGKTDVSEMFKARDEIYSKVFPDEVLLDVCGDESINDGFFSIIDVENSCKGNFIDYDVKNICNLDDSLCEMLSLQSSSQDGFGEDSQYGVIGDMGQYLGTPFIKHSGRFYSFVTRFSLERIHARIADLYPAKAVAEEDSFDECIDENTEEEDVEDVAEDDDSKDIVSEEEVLDTYEDESDEYDEPLEEFFPLVASDQEQPSIDDGEGWDSSKEETGDETQQGEYTALVGDDAYSYLDDVLPEEFESDPLLDEQDSLYEEDDDGDDSDDESVVEDEIPQDQDDPYSEKSLFDVCDEDGPEVSDEQSDAPDGEDCTENDETSEEESIVEDELEEEPIIEDEGDTIEETVVEEEPSEDTEPVQEGPVEEAVAPGPVEPVSTESEVDESKAEPASLPEPEVEAAAEPAHEASILGQVLRSFAKSNPVVQYVEQCSEEQRDELAGVMEKALAACREDGKDKMFAIPDTTISVCIFRTTRDPMLEIQRRENVGALMFAGGHDTWNSLELYVNELGSLVKCEYRKVTRFSFSDWEWKIVEKLGQRILDRRGR